MSRKGNDQRHHAAHPPSSVSPNLAVNKSPNVAAAPNANPSLGTVGTTPLDTVNGRVYGGTGFASDPAIRPVVARNGGDNTECDDPEEEPNLSGDCPEDVERSKKIS